MQPSLARLCDAVRASAEQQVPLRIVGGGTWLDAGRPVAAREQLCIGDHDGVTEYVPGDLTITLRANSSLGAVQAAAAEHGQWLPLDPAGVAAGTVGATVATGSYGPLVHAFGTPRDHVLGMDVVTGTGEIVRAGGRVVKNVAGFDLTRLFTGAWGTLGVIANVTLRLRALPTADVTLMTLLDGPAREVAGALDALQRDPPACLALHVVNAALARRLGLPSSAAAIARVGEDVARARAKLGSVAPGQAVTDADPAVWSALSTVEPAGASVVRVSDLPSRFAELWRGAGAIGEAAPDALISGTPSRGVIRVIFAAASRLEGGIVGRLMALGGTCIFERLPPELWSTVPPAATDPLSRGIRGVFDPSGILNPGILGAELE